jgi:hypothetical protein
MKKNIDIDNFVKTYKQKGDIIQIKIEPFGISCCCSHCLPEFWKAINTKISPQGPIEHEGGAIVNLETEHIILEQHESGPEIVAFVSSLITIFDFVKWLFLSAMDSFKKKGITKVKIIKRTITTERKIVNETILEIDVNNSETLDKQLNKLLK